MKKKYIILKIMKIRKRMVMDKSMINLGNYYLMENILMEIKIKGGNI